MLDPAMTPAALLAAQANGDTTAEEIVTQTLDDIRARDSDIGAFLYVDEQAVETARAIDAKRAAGESMGLLAGIPVALKDIVCTAGQPTTCGSRMLENFVPPYDAGIVERLRAADAVLIGRVNMDEFAMGSSTENSAFQLTRNPWDQQRTPGGSSGGSAAAVGGSLVPLAVGSDTGGSIRQPASFCGCVGLKPTYGRVSRYGLVAFASSLDQLGPLASDVHGAALLLEVMAGHDSRDSTSVNCPVPAYSQTVNDPLAGLKIGIVPSQISEGLDPDVEKTFHASLDAYKAQGATIHEIEMPHAKYAIGVYYLIAPCEASSNLARYDGVHYGYRAENFSDMIDMYASSRGEAFGNEVKRRIMLGTYALSEGYKDAYYLKALKVRRLIRQDFDAAFETVDVIASPVTPAPAFKIGEMIDDPLQMYLSDVFTLSANLAGLPGISVPAGMSTDGLPVGLQLLAPPFAEDRLFRAARMLERTLLTAESAPEFTAATARYLS